MKFVTEPPLTKYWYRPVPVEVKVTEFPIQIAVSASFEVQFIMGKLFTLIAKNGIESLAQPFSYAINFTVSRLLNDVDLKIVSFTLGVFCDMLFKMFQKLH